jgi:GMP synthase-like glutamine amidotransferase
MRVLAIVHQRDAGPGVFADAIRSCGAELEFWMPPGAEAPPRDPRGYDAVLVFGGAMHVDQEDRNPWLSGEKRLLEGLLGEPVPVLGVCLGAQLLAEAAGAAPRPASLPEIGWHEVELTPEAVSDPLLAPLAPRFLAFQWHSYEFPLPPEATLLARSASCLQAYRLGDAAWGIQFHAEVTREDAETWIDDYRSDEDAVRLVDPEELRQRTRSEIARWNALGRGLCERFMTTVATRV